MARKPAESKKRGPKVDLARIRAVVEEQQAFQRAVDRPDARQFGKPDEPVVQFSVRVPQSLRGAVRDAAAAQGRTTQDFTLDALQAHLRRAEGSAPRSTDLHEFLDAFADHVRSGGYAEEIAATVEPDLRVN